jgi:pimeloyl-ACP methyl ester carboxylesterase
MSSSLLRFDDWISPVPYAPREVVSLPPEEDTGLPPVLFVPGLGHGPWAYQEHWLPYTAARGFPAHTLALRPGGDFRAYVHDVIQVAAELPRQAVFVGHGAGALIVARALSRYPARAAVLAAPVLGGWTTVGAALRANFFGTLPAVFGGRARLSRRQLFSPEMPVEDAEAFRQLLSPATGRSQRELVRHPEPAKPVGNPPVLVVGSPDDRVVPRSSLDRTAARYGSAPLLFPDMGHDLMLDVGRAEPIGAILDWLTKELTKG